jgi:hypothetical protein
VVPSQDRYREGWEDAYLPATTTLNTTRRQTRRFLSSKWGHYSILLLVSLDVSCIFSDFIIQIFRCEGRINDKNGATALEALGIVSLVFSCLFMTELLASVWAFGPR